MIKKIVHLADIHIRNIKRHEEYKEQFVKLIDKLTELLKDDYEYDEVRILLVGDIFHQKITISNEQIILFSWLMRELTSIAPVIIIAGNHDFIVSNTDRIDSITPIVEALSLPNLTYLDKLLNYKSGVYLDENIAWLLYSIFDNYQRPDIDLSRISNPDKKYIGLFHGAITGSKTFNGYDIEHGVGSEIFNGCDAVLCGDIHLKQETYLNDIKIVYPGSFAQQDKGETVSGHGFLLWDVETLEYEEYDINNDYSIYKFVVNSFEDVENGKEEFINF